MSPLLAPDLREIERAVDALLQRNPQARILGMRSPVRRDWKDVLERQGARFRIAWCVSELEVREQLDEAEIEGSDRVVVLTPLSVATLADDVVARFPRARLEQSDRWTALRTAFQARDVDSRLREFRWLADLLVERAPPTGYAPAPSGLLDLETAWRTALEQILALPEARADALALLRWTLDPVGTDRLVHLPDEARQAITRRIADVSGPTGALLFRIVLSGRALDALPLALVCGVVFGEISPRAGLRDAAVRLEPLVGGARLDPDVGRALAEAGRRMILQLWTSSEPADVAEAHGAQLRATSLLAEIRATDAADLSPALEVGLEARVRSAAAALTLAASSLSIQDASAAWALTQRAVEHNRAFAHGERIDRLMMAARLCGWLAKEGTPTVGSMAEAAVAYGADSSFADRARIALRGGDAIAVVASAYAHVLTAATTRRERENEAFALLLRDWGAAGGSAGDPIPVERLLDSVVTPLAGHAPVLLLVLDGLSIPVWHTLAPSFRRLGFTEFCPRGQIAPLLGVAVLPSVTEVSRSSLLSGSLTRGDQGTERAGFTAHRQLRAKSSATMPPRLFHKADLGGGPELGHAVSEAISNIQQRIVGVVHNAVDAQLSGSDQLEMNWSAEVLRHVAPLLYAARSAGRIVIVTGDHGHVIDGGTTQQSGGHGDRWRAGGRPAEAGELTVSGARVLSPAGGPSLIAAWSERIRYAAKRGGYHGGVSPQEMLVPIAILGAGAPPEGWEEAPLAEPAWWRGTTNEAATMSTRVGEMPPTVEPARRRSAEPSQTDLFHRVPPQLPSSLESSAAAYLPAQVSTSPAWIDVLIQSEPYSAQRRLAGRGAPADDQLRALLVALTARGGRLSQAGLAQALRVSALRISGLISAARRILNLDQAQVLSMAGEEILLDERLLKTQFGLGDGP